MIESTPNVQTEKANLLQQESQTLRQESLQTLRQESLQTLRQESSQTRQEIEQASEEHKVTFQHFSNHENIFITGVAGTGKTFLTSQLISYSHLLAKKVLVTSTTGISSLLLGGITLHSLLGLKPDEVSIYTTFTKWKERLQRYKNNTLHPYTRDRMEAIRNADLLIIDECSMLSAWLLEMLDWQFRIVRENCQVLGGVQVLFVGDFRQLPPIYRDIATNNSETDLEHFKSFADIFNKHNQLKGFHCFKSAVWNALHIQICELHRSFRQCDELFVGLLHHISMNVPLNSLQQQLLKDRMCVNNPVNNSPVLAEAPTGVIHIMIKNEDVRQINQLRYNNLLQEKHAKEQHYVFPLHVSFLDQKTLQDLEDSIRQTLHITNSKQSFCEGARVMCRVNTKQYGIELVNGDTGTIIGFERGEDGLFYPKVAWDRIGCEANNTTLITPFVFKQLKHSIVNGTYIETCVAQIKAIPLMLCWAMTVHKVQGSTIPCALDIDCRGMDSMECTFYVALSRAKKADQIYLRNFYGRYRHSKEAEFFYLYPNLPMDPEVIQNHEKRTELILGKMQDTYMVPITKSEELVPQYMSIILHALTIRPINAETRTELYEKGLVPLLDLCCDIYAPVPYSKRKNGLEPLLDKYTKDRQQHKDKKQHL
jgi:ATP-dependent exoDNAse (exonuclease V) alpha subunit